ncbi:MAG TPA: hypothetical protein VHD85_14150 [Terracidiphilus sp.]|nr:hypothetical protein [Terracidiphilus sp.]
MGTVLNQLTSPVRSVAVKTWTTLFLAMVLGLCTPQAVAGGAPPLPIVVTGAAKQLAALTGGGWDGSQSPLSGTFAVGPNGDVIIGNGYSSNVYQITPGGTETTLTGVIGGSAVAIDSNGNVYAGGYYNSNIFKIPYNAATGTYAGFTTAPTTNCLGGTKDTSACIFAPGAQYGGYADLAFDAQGDLFIATGTVPSTNPNTIYECDVACLASPTATPTLIYTDSNAMGAMALDPWGNIFFTDGNNNSNKTTYLNEIPLQSGVYASTPTVLQSYTNKAGYNNGFSGVAVGSNGTIYFATNGDGIFAIPNTQTGGPNVAGLYMVSTVGGKGITIDSKGNLYQIPYNNGDVVSYIPIGNVTLGATTPGGTATTATANIIDSNGGCTPTLTLAATESGATTTEFTAAAGSCGGGLGTSNGTWSPAVTLTGSVTPATITFNPKSAGARNAAFTVTDTTANATGMAALTGTGQSAWVNIDPGVATALTSGFTSPAAVVADAAGDLFVADAGAGKVFEVAAGTTTPVAIGSGFTTPDALAFDANGNLFVADNGVPDVVEIPNTGTTGAFAAGTQQTIISSTTAFGGTVLASPVALAVGPKGTLYITDSSNKRVVSYSLPNGLPGSTLANAANGLENPAGIAVDGAGDLYVADPSLNEVLIFWSGGGITTVTPPNVTEATGVAVDASGSVLVADGGAGNVVRIPNLNGTLTTAQAITVETAPSKLSSLWMDAAGDLFGASASGSSVYGVVRLAGQISLGTVQDGATNTGTVYLMNAGNASATLASPAVTQPSNTMFTLAAPATNGCDDGSSGPAGAACQLTATFAPPVNTPDGLQTGTATVSFTAPAGSVTVTMSGTASISSIQGQTITNFSPNSTLLIGQQITLSATGGGSGNPVVFSIDPGSPCTSCASINGTTLTALAVGSVIVDANQAAGTNNGVQYAKAPQVQATIAINNATVAGVPALLMTQQNWLAALPAGGAFAQDSAAGSSFDVNPQGNVLIGTAYGGTVALYNTQSGAWTTLGQYGKYNNTGGVAVDSAGNLYIGALYSNIIAKIPYNNGAYSTVTDATSGTAPANCTGSDTAECVVAAVAATSGIGGVSAMTFDAQGDLFIGTDDQGGNPWSIWECTAACLATGSPAPVMLYQEPAGNNSSTTVGQLYTGGLAVDPWGNLFFTDSYLINQSSNANKSNYSDLYELRYTAGTGYASTPTLLETFTVTTPSSYDDQLDGVAVTAAGTIYYTIGYDGVFAIPNTQAGGPQIANQYVIAGQGAKEIALDASGNIYYVAYHGSGDTLGQILVNNLVAPVAQLNGAPVTASATVVDNAFGCGSAAIFSIASSNPEFSATGGTSCSSIAVSSGNGALTTPVAAASSYPATITFAATKGGPQTATLTVTDTANGGKGTAMVTGIGEETPQTITFTVPTTTSYTYAPGLTITLGATGGDSGNPVVFSVDSSSTGAGSISGTTLTVTTAGTIVIDANQAAGLNSSTGIYYSAAPQVQLTLTVVQATQAISFTAPASPVTYSSGLTISLTATGGASGNPVVFTVDPSSTGAGTVSGSTLTVTTAGTIVIDANQAGNANYSAAPQMQQTVVVNKASQTITFTPPSAPIHFIAGGITINLVATGGGSGNPVVFTIDPSSTGVGSVSGSVLTVTALGDFVINANQAGDANYTAAPQAQETIAVLSALPTQTITFANPGTQVVGTPLTLTASATSGFAVSFASGTTSVCTVAQSGSTWTAAFASAGTCTITATQPGDNATFAAAPPVSQTFTVNPTGQIPAINLSFTLSSLTMAPGTVGLTQLTVNSQNNFTGTVSFACSGLPSGYSCTFNPNPITVPQGGAASTSLSISPSTTAAAIPVNSKPLLPLTTLAAAVCFLGLKKRRRLMLLVLVAIAVAGLGVLSGCGGSSSSSTTKATTTTATVTATSGSVKQSATLTITVE